MTQKATQAEVDHLRGIAQTLLSGEHEDFTQEARELARQWKSTDWAAKSNQEQIENFAEFTKALQQQPRVNH